MSIETREGRCLSLRRFYQIKREKKTRDKEINGTRTESRGLTGKPAMRPVREGIAVSSGDFVVLATAPRPSVADIPFPPLLRWPFHGFFDRLVVSSSVSFIAIEI